jgi:hypothetical protein
MFALRKRIRRPCSRGMHAMWAAGVVFGLSAGAWTISVFNVEWRSSSPSALVRGIEFRSGAFAIGAFSSTRFPGQPGWHTSGVEWPQFWWWPAETPMFGGGHSDGRGYWWMIMPLWIPAIGSGALWMGTWLLKHRLLQQRVRRGQCRVCGYDLAGSSGICPECGSDTDHSVRPSDRRQIRV